VNLPLGAAAFAFGAVFLSSEPQPHPGRFDRPGFALSGLGLGLLMYGVSEGPVTSWGSADVLGAIVAGALLLVAMVRVELATDSPLVDLRLLGNRLFRSTNVVMVLVSVSFLGTLYAISLYYQDGRGLTPLQSGLNTAPEAIGVMMGAQLASRFLYPRLGPRRHISAGLAGVGLSIGLLSLLGAQSSLWWARVLMFTLGLSMAQVFVPTQAAAFATISPAATGRASTMFNALRQLGGAIGVGALTTAIVIVGPTRRVSGHVVANVGSYHAAFLVAAAFSLSAIFAALTIKDADAARTIQRRHKQVATGRTAGPQVAVAVAD